MTERNDNAPKESAIREDIAPLVWISFFLLSYVFLPAFILSVFLLLRVGSPALAFWGSLAVLSGLLWIKRSKIGIIGCLCFLLIVISAHAVSWRFFDVFADSFAYHQPAIVRIATGFNPVHDGYMYLSLGRPSDNWSTAATYFPKATWYFAASVYAALGDIQTGTAFHLILMFSALFFVLHHTQEERVMKRLLWVLACLNPIVFLQSTGHVVDSALGSLSIIALFYANMHFSGKAIPRDAHIMAIMSLAIMFCIKATGVAFGGIIVLCICFHRLFTEYFTSKNSWGAAFASATKLGLRIGVPLFLLVAVLGFSPYLTNLLEGKHIFHPLIQYEIPADRDIPQWLENMANAIFPYAHNRVTRLLRSIASYPSMMAGGFLYPAALKSPLWAPWQEWTMYMPGSEFAASGLGPLFFLLLLVSLPYVLFSRAQGNRWLIFTLCAMILIHPHPWLFRYVPFLWAMPLIFCLSAPRRWEYLLAIPILLATLNTGGVAYFSFNFAEEFRRRTVETLAPHRGEYVLLDRSIFWNDGIFNRFGIKQRFANPEQTVFSTFLWGGPFRERRIAGRLAFGSNIAFEKDIPPLPSQPVVFAEKYSEPWRVMSGGLVLHDPDAAPTLFTMFSHDLDLPTGFWNRSGTIKFFMRVTERPVDDMVFALTASLREREGIFRAQKMYVYANYRQIGEWLWDQPGPEERTITISQEMLEESYNSPLTLLPLMFHLSDVETGITRGFSIALEKMEFRPAEQP